MTIRRTTCLPAILTLALMPVVQADDSELEFEAKLSTAETVPNHGGKTKGKASFEVSNDFSSIRYKIRLNTRGDVVGLLGVAGAHIHCAPFGATGPIAATLAGIIPGGVNGSTEIKATLTDANINETACGSSIDELVESMMAGDTYVNAHSSANPSGEARGQIALDD